MHSFQHGIGQIVQKPLGNKGVNKELIFLEEFFEHFQMIWFVVIVDILKDEHDPLGDVHFEEFIFSDQLSDNFIDCIVEFMELFSFVMLVGKYLLLDVHLHVK